MNSIKLSSYISSISSMDNDCLSRRRKQRRLLAVLGGLIGVTAVLSVAQHKTAYHTSILTGMGWLTELYKGNELRFKEQLGMHKHVFCRLVKDLKRKTGLQKGERVFCSTVLQQGVPS